MSGANHFSDRLREPLNETTRKARRNLMAASVIGVILTKVGLVPSKISAFGIEFSSSNQQALMLLLVATIAYFAISFVVYAYSELTAWQIVFTSNEIEELRARAEARHKSDNIFGGFETPEEKEFRAHVRKLYFRSKPSFYLRLLIELLVPIVFAMYSCMSLLFVEIPADIKNDSTQQEEKL